MKTFQDLALALCKREGKKQQVNIAQVSELLKCLCALIRKDPIGVLGVLLKSSGKKGK